MSWFRILSGALFASALVIACTDDPVDASASAATTRSDVVADDGGAHRPAPPRPPRESIDACARAQRGDACAFDIDGHHVTGTCTSAPDGSGPLACAPDHPPPPPKPPQEALDACNDKHADDACTVALPDGTSLDGTCLAPPDGSGALACAPPM
jgi:hypothetical protein